MDVAYKPPQVYSKELETAINKTQLLTGIMVWGQRVLIDEELYRSALGTTRASLYIVPEGYSFFISSVYMDLYSRYDARGYLIINTGTLLLKQSYENQTHAIMQPHAIPIKMNATEELKVELLVNVVGGSNLIVCVCGYLVPNSALPTFI